MTEVANRYEPGQVLIIDGVRVLYIPGPTAFDPVRFSRAARLMLGPGGSLSRALPDPKALANLHRALSEARGMPANTAVVSPALLRALERPIPASPIDVDYPRQNTDALTAYRARRRRRARITKASRRANRGR